MDAPHAETADSTDSVKPERFVIERQDGFTDCTHPLCETLHERFHEYFAGGGAMHVVAYVQWHVWDNERDDYASHEAREFDTKREAKAWLDAFIERGAVAR